MSTIDLIILGILIKRPMNAYEIVQYVENDQVDRMIKISVPAIYKSCKRLFQAGYLIGKTEKEGENPEKVIYSINAAGKKYFYELIRNFSSKVQPFYIDFNAVILNLDRLDREEGLATLLTLKKQIFAWKKWILEHEKDMKSAPFPVKSIIKQYRMTFSALFDWIEQTIREFKKE
ncbi:transcriptional regulator, PadR family [Leptospira broomii serovar Hurstbridge str. 5399]|uniref:Transcriptional regulator, PadR family n=1 Tax=Leptospira broomii serovar Hurstbridge str. 5399 TaxID=1049789 RepID=T0EZ22_9LEPT|nr:PadR family transcriptional regulator [Leptospira broomii]EQA44095.1 transcriptional regulator, PadR family [Leptospira broomii serovar Hurstbridge str. 5399]